MCGGQSAEGVSNNCFGYDFETDSWSMLGEMPEPKIASNNAYDVHWGIVMAGGQAEGGQSTDSVYETMDGIFFNRLQNLPVPSRDKLSSHIDDLNLLSPHTES